ncbi:RNA polymerase sigma factor [Streptomyces monashensis]|uniref:RNA polymerase subunit sigma-24 n=1 Tax=Streptomyces monashensis TaxID=1678012 RepID=A0A1S2PTZ3_9ACTN|nr:RNA polymerase sigma factor [Streptomyces monashensis]OIJ97032.1 RNA polymerase subunit sigma-24 [Streptomyces monashensis]
MDEQLPERLAVDLDDGFTELVRVHSAAVRTFLFRVSGSATDADDLGQETFLRAYAALRGYELQRRRELRPRAWLMTIAANVWRNHVRTNVRRPVSTTPVEDACQAWPDTAPGPEERVATAEDRVRLVSALTELPENPRIAVVLRHVVGLSYGEIAEARRCPVGTVKAQVSRGIDSLRQLLDAKAPPTREVLR